MTIFVEHCQRSLLTQRPAVSNARNERAGELTENEVVGLDTVDGSCRRGTRCEPSEPTTFFACSHGHRKADMASHERWTIRIEATPAHKRILKEFRRRHFGRHQISDTEIAAFMLKLAFTVPRHLSGACEFLVRYRDAEECNQAMEQITNTVAAAWGKAKA